APARDRATFSRAPRASQGLGEDLMVKTVPPRSEIPIEYTWDMASVFPSDQAFEEEFTRVQDAIPDLARFRDRLADDPATLADWFDASVDVLRGLGKLSVYASSMHNVDTADPAGKARNDRVAGLRARIQAATAFDEPEILAIGAE